MARPTAGACMRYRFDEFEIDGERFEIRRGGTVQPVEPLVFDLILFLARSPGRVLAREAIVEHVWDGRAVSEATIDGAIKSARRVLGDTGANPRYIRTIRGRGFEFRADVESIVPATDDDTEAPEVPGPSRASVADDTKPVIAVLPFANLSGDDDAYFSDGLTEDIITNLARFRDLRVIAGASVFPFKDQVADLAEIRERLRAEYVVRGSVRRAEGRMRVTAQLIESTSGQQLWGDRYDREQGNLFDLQDDLTRTIAAALGVRIQELALRRALVKSPDELDAFDSVLRARRYTGTLDPRIHAEARDLLERAVERDPLSADAHALLANVYLGEHRFDMNKRPNPVGRALTHALAATRLDPENAYARCWLAIVHFFQNENDKFEAEASLAVQLNPNDPETLADIGHYLSFLGEFERGVALTRRAQQLNPLHPGWYYFSFARLHYHQRDYHAVISDMERAGLPDFYWSYLLRAAAHGQLGHAAEAKAALARMLELKPEFSAGAELRKWNAAPDDMAHILEGLRKAGLREGD